MEPPLRIAGLRTRPTTAGYTSGRATFRTKSPRSIDRQSPVALDGDNLRAVRQSRFRADRRAGPGCAMFPRFPPPGPVWADARPAPERFARLGAFVTRPCFCRPCPSTGAGGAFLPRPGLAVFRHSRVSGKRSQTLNSLGGKT